MNIGMNVTGCLICYNNLSSFAEDCPREWTSNYVHVDVRGRQYWPQETEVHAALDLLGTQNVCTYMCTVIPYTRKL